MISGLPTWANAMLLSWLHFFALATAVTIIILIFCLLREYGCYNLEYNDDDFEKHIDNIRREREVRLQIIKERVEACRNK